MNRCVLGTTAVAITASLITSVYPQNKRNIPSLQQSVVSTKAQRFTPKAIVNEGIPGNEVTEAPTGFDDLTNGFDPQGTDFDQITAASVVALRSFNDNRFIFEEFETVKDGLGPTFNAQGCRECHQNVVTGGASQVSEQRVGRMEGGQFFDSLGGSLLHSRAIHPDIVERVPSGDLIRTLRISTNTLGAGYVEAIPNGYFAIIQESQPPEMRGIAPTVPVLEANSIGRFGRFGWKSQHASLESFAGDAYLNEMGITNPLFPEENTSAGYYVGWGTEYDKVADPEDDGVDLKAFANFMRATKAPSRGPVGQEALKGEEVFNKIGCNICHQTSLKTAPAGTQINGGALTVHPAIGDKIFHPYSDFMLHDVGTGDGIPIQPTPEFANTANKMRTAPLWALRTRNRLMHDGLSLTKENAILRHRGQATPVISNYRALSPADVQLLMTFLDSL